jgi:hypothetical protein
MQIHEPHTVTNGVDVAPFPEVSGQGTHVTDFDDGPVPDVLLDA